MSTDKNYQLLYAPTTRLIGATQIEWTALFEYLHSISATDFINEARRVYAEQSDPGSESCGITAADVLISFYAKVCYASHAVGRNANLSSVRSIEDNVAASISSGHGSILEHINLNFVTSSCSRVFTHELVRHRVGTAFSQTSGRYVRTDMLSVVIDPILKDVENYVEDAISHCKQSYDELCDLLGLNGLRAAAQVRGIDPNDTPRVLELARKLGFEEDRMSLPGHWVMSFDRKKKLTSAVRRILPQGIANDIGWSANIRALRHTIQMRTARSSEWEIRLVFNDVYKIVKNKYPLLFKDAEVQMVDGLLEVSGMKMSPYEQTNAS